MIRNASHFENAGLERIAKQYRDEGFEVSIRPQQLDLPDFLQGLEIDLIAKRPDVTVVIEVKRSSESKPKESIKFLSQALKDRPGYRFDFISLRRTKKGAAIGAIDDGDLCDRLAETEYLLDKGSLNAAMVLAWSAAEGVLRRLARRERLDVEGQSPAFLIKTLFSQGLLTREQYDSLNDAMRHRNMVVHGFSINEIEGPVIRNLVIFAKSLIDCSSKGIPLGDSKGDLGPSRS